jgi:hypothetical protein
MNKSSADSAVYRLDSPHSVCSKLLATEFTCSISVTARFNKQYGYIRLSDTLHTIGQVVTHSLLCCLRLRVTASHCLIITRLPICKYIKFNYPRTNIVKHSMYVTKYVYYMKIKTYRLLMIKMLLEYAPKVESSITEDTAK